jgi:hypothetical protein
MLSLSKAVTDAAMVLVVMAAIAPMDGTAARK